MVTIEEFKEVLQRKNIPFTENEEQKAVIFSGKLYGNKPIHYFVSFIGELGDVTVAIPICQYNEPDQQEAALKLINELNINRAFSKYFMNEDGHVSVLGYLFPGAPTVADLSHMISILADTLQEEDYMRFMKLKWCFDAE